MIVFPLYCRQWISGIGKEIILSSGRNEKLQNIDIFTKSGKLTPLELVEVFKYKFYNKYHSSKLKHSFSELCIIILISLTVR